MQYHENTIPQDYDINQDDASDKICIKGELLKIGQRCELWHAPQMQAFASVPNGQNVRIDSTVFREWLSERIFREYNIVPSQQALTEAINTLAGHAKFNGRQYRSFIRMGHTEDAIYVDLARDDSVIEITADGWQLINDCPVKFISPPGQLPLPNPIDVQGHAIDGLSRLLNLNDEGDFKLIVGWLLAGC